MGERAHNYKAPLNKPHQRDLASKSYTPSYEVSKSHHYKESTTHRSDMSQMVGPIYNTGKVNMTKHSFTEGYQAPKARQDQVDLVGKFFKKETAHSSFEETKAEEISTTVSKSGEERKQEALKRREEREAFILQTVQRIKEEASSLSQRLKNEEEKRLELIQLEEQRIKQQEIMRQEAMLKAEEERKKKEIARIEEMRKKKELRREEKAMQEKQMREKYQREEEERRMKEQSRIAEERKQQEYEKQEARRREEEYRRNTEIKQLEEKRMLERQQLESLIEKESKVTKGQVTRRSDDPFGQGFGFVKTGFVSSQKLSFLQQASSVDRYDSRSDLCGVSPTPSQSSGKTKSGLRVTWAESPGSSRPTSNLGWTEKVT